MATTLLPLLVACNGTAPEPDLQQHGVVSCPNPDAREALGPLERIDLGTSWQSQVVDPWIEEAPWGPGITIADLDGDGQYDVVTPNKDIQIYTDQSGEWREESLIRFPPHPPRYTRQAAAADVDGDGDLDLLLVNQLRDELWLNDGSGHFTDASAESGLGELDEVYAGQASTWADVNGDGTLDVFVSNRRTADGPHPPNPAHPNVLLINQGDATFVDESQVFAGTDALNGYTYLSSFHDFDSDLDPDLYIVNDVGSLAYPNSYQRNDSGADTVAFRDQSTQSGLGLAINGMGLGVGDLNGDEVPDLVVTDWGALHLMESSMGEWFDVAASRGLRADLDERRWLSWGAELADLDNDGRSDVAVGFGPTVAGDGDTVFGEMPTDEPDDLFLQQEDGSFVSMGHAWGFDSESNTRAVVAVDFDRDGWLDLFSKAVDAPATYFHQRCGSNAWLEVDLVGLPPNTAGIGARVTVEAGQQVWRRWIQSGGTSLAASAPPVAHFGLGDLDVVDRVTVAWRDGEEVEYSAIETRQRLTIAERP